MSEALKECSIKHTVFDPLRYETALKDPYEKFFIYLATYCKEFDISDKKNYEIISYDMNPVIIL